MPVRFLTQASLRLHSIPGSLFPAQAAFSNSNCEDFVTLFRKLMLILAFNEKDKKKEKK